MVEFTMVLPIVLLVVVVAAEFGLVFDDLLTVGYGSREGARVGAALAKGDVDDCTGGADPAGVDNAIVAAVQRILKSPGSGIDIDQVQEIRIFKATASGGETAGSVNVWRYTGEGTGPEVDPGPGVLNLDFSPFAEPWPACIRVNNGAGVESLGVRVVYRYHMVTPISSLLELLGGSQAASVTLSETTVMALNPTV
jgi:TadE-like protein